MTLYDEKLAVKEIRLYSNGSRPQTLIERVGETHFRQRNTIEQHHAGDVFGRGRTRFHIENADWIMDALYSGLKWTGLFKRGLQNILDIKVVENNFFVPGLPRAFSGFTIMQLSDLHIDIAPGLAEAIIERLQSLEYDLCVITGDYKWRTEGPAEPALAELRKLVPYLQHPAYAVLGNHDFLEFVPPMEELGLPFLLNETVTLERNGERIYLSGVDDPHFYETYNLQKTGDKIPQSAVSILLAHSPEIYRQVAAAGYDIKLCGHTHAGQICLPGRIPLLNNANCPRDMVYGPWEFHRTQGYTSAGTGSSGVPVRFFCPPEITLHRLYPAP
ncbi:MAG: metallophosphoesterase [Candidatus Promineifilaceae bacterium]